DVEKTGAWETATFDRDTELGEGSKTVTVKVSAEEKELTFTIHTDKATLGEALKEHDLIIEENGLIHTVIGIYADWENGNWWWKFTKNGEMMMVGVDGTTIENDEQYELTRTK
ncbi:MAG: hypothetical protein J6U87_03100, partial [Clostridia bacterium]|nr:hypothetical protein [Clostridia bacterium]